ncbi:MAG: site-specific integrase [Oscillospiraceae bacterium]|nr:site-specific integrase [Oscillospiraceae bacterium]
MVNKLSSQIFINKHINKQGKSKLYLQITISRKTRRYPLNVFVCPGDFSLDKKLLVAGKDKNIVNRHIVRELNKANDVYLKMIDQKIEVDFNNFEELYLNRNTTTLSHAFELHTQKITKVSAKPFNTVLSELIRLFGDVAINDIKLKQVQDYHNSIKHLQNNTIWAKHKVLKSVINTAILNNIYKNESPYKVFKFKYVQTMKTYLNMIDLEKITTLLNNDNVPQMVKNAAKSFLVQCYTGLRYSDISILTWADIKEGYVSTQTEKTKEIIYIPLPAKAKIIIGDPGPNNEKIFKVPSNQKYNDHLKLVAMYANIDKNITSHVARHTFAIISIELGIPIEVISKILGHKTLKTTKVYAQIVNPVIDNYMKRWDL